MRAHSEGNRDGEPDAAELLGAAGRGGGMPSGFTRHDVRGEELRILFEAARCCPSSFNEQPWRFIVARRDDHPANEAMRSCLTGSPRWVETAPLLMLVAVHTRFVRTRRINENAHQDVGRAMGRLVARAMMIELYVPRVGAVLRDRARSVFDIPDDVEVVDAAAIGFVGAEPLSLDELGQLAAETCARPRKALEELVYESSWGTTARFLESSRSRNG